MAEVLQIRLKRVKDKGTQFRLVVRDGGRRKYVHELCGPGEKAKSVVDRVLAAAGPTTPG